jgi:tetratricopeptide (TPR) repeat protein
MRPANAPACFPRQRHGTSISRLFPAWAALLISCGIGGAHAAALPADVAEAEKLFRTGRYDECARMVDEEIGNDGWNESWRELKIRTELARGNHAQAIGAVEEALRRFPASISLHLLGYDIYRRSGRDQDAASELDMLERLARFGPRRSATAQGVTALGRYFLLRGEDARQVLDRYYDAVTKQQPNFLEAHFATAELALDKDDDELAAGTLRKAPEAAHADPEYHYLMARALSDGDRAASEKSLDEALKINPHHADSLLLRADHLIDSERYKEADGFLKQVLDVDPLEPRTWAYQAVLAHLRSDEPAETAAHAKALSRWSSNPNVDHLIGRKLSQKYRFAEGAARQRQALEIDVNYAPAKIQLCQDLLRLGDESEGWKLAAEVFGKDAYNVVAYNLVTLHDKIAGFRAVEDDGLTVRMVGREADLYGQRVLTVLKRAKKKLCDRYAVALTKPIIVEIFPERKDFGVRTFGLPGADGLLGVCFGSVITAISPAAHGEHPSNWEAVLWHEFCHVVTLTKTRNKMPRWLSEGISVYEEGRENPAYATSLSPQFRAMILDESFVPLSQLSSAFLASKTALHLQFAYFESALAAEFLVDRWGLQAVNGLLDDLGAGRAINDALPRRTEMSLDQLDGEFARFARQRASKTAPGATWEDPELPADANSVALTGWLQKHPKSFEGQRRLAARLIAEEKWQEAKIAAEKFKALYPEYVGPDNAYLLLAVVYRRLSQPADERAALEALAMRDGDAIPAYLRLAEIEEAAGDWRGVAQNAERVLAVNPQLPAPYRALARAAEKLGDRDGALAACRALVQLDDADIAGAHYRMARLLREAGKLKESRREVLRSLEEAPRFREAHELLLDLVDRETPAPAGSVPAPVRGPIPKVSMP